jgi:predicted nucleotidyltransferase
MTDLESIKNKINNSQYNFLKSLQTYLGEDLFFYGSINRIDYFRDSSDLDIAVITDNIYSIKNKLIHYLNINKKEIKKIYQKFDSKMIKGYKIKYTDKYNNFDLLLYDKQYEKNVLQNIYDINNMPFYITFVLLILKMIYYKLKIISKTLFLDIKNFIFYVYFNKKIDFNQKNFMTTILI